MTPATTEMPAKFSPGEGAEEVPAAFIDAVVKLRGVKPSPTDIASAMPEQCGVVNTDAHGNERMDYENVPLRNSDGSLTKAGKNLIDLHAPQAKLGAELSRGFAGTQEKPVVLKDGHGRRMPVPPRLADYTAKRLGLKPVINWGQCKEKVYRRPDGALVTLTRGRGGVTEVALSVKDTAAVDEARRARPVW